MPPGVDVLEGARAALDTPFLLSRTLEIGSDRSFEADFDFSGQPVGLELEVTADGSTGTKETLNAVIVESTSSETPEPTEAPEETAEPTATATEEPTAMETPGQPGFGVIVVLLAFMAAALLAIRRDQDSLRPLPGVVTDFLFLPQSSNHSTARQILVGSSQRLSEDSGQERISEGR